MPIRIDGELKIPNPINTIESGKTKILKIIAKTKNDLLYLAETKIFRNAYKQTTHIEPIIRRII